MDFIVDQTTNLISCALSNEMRVEDHFRSQHSVEEANASECFTSNNPFDQLDTEHKQVKFYKEHFNLVVSTYSQCCVYAHSHVCVYVCLCMCLCVCARTCVCVCMCVW